MCLLRIVNLFRWTFLPCLPLVGGGVGHGNHAPMRERRQLESLCVYPKCVILHVRVLRQRILRSSNWQPDLFLTKRIVEREKMKFVASIALLVAGSNAFNLPAFSRRTSALHMSGILSSQTGQSSLDPAVVDRYNALPWPEDKVLAEYVWVDAVGNTRSKTRTLSPSKVCLCWSSRRKSHLYY